MAVTEWLFDHNGDPQILFHDGLFISKMGIHLGWKHGDSVVTPLLYRHLGWWEDWVLTDAEDFAVGFAAKRIKRGYMERLPTLRSTPPIPAIPTPLGEPPISHPRNRPGPRGIWSEIQLENYFD